jgi:hypothetical protein
MNTRETVPTSFGDIRCDRYESPNGRYFAARDRLDDRFFLFGPNGEMYHRQGLIISKIAVSDSGCAVVAGFCPINNRTGNRTDKKGQDNSLCCVVYAFSGTGELIYRKKFNRHCGQVGISSDGTILAVGLMNPDACIKVIEASSLRTIASIKGWLFGCVTVDPESRIITDVRYNGDTFSFQW